MIGKASVGKAGLTAQKLANTHSPPKRIQAKCQ